MKGAEDDFEGALDDFERAWDEWRKGTVAKGCGGVREWWVRARWRKGVVA